MNYIVKVINSICEINKDDWDNIVGEKRILFSYNYLKAVELSKLPNFKHIYVLVYSNDKIVAHTCVNLMRYPLETFLDGIAKKILFLFRKVIPFNSFYIKTLECGGAASLGNPVSINKDENNQYEIMNLMIEQIENIFKDSNATILLFRDFFESDLHNLLPSFEKYNYFKIKIYPLTTLKIKWNSYNEYINSMRSHYKYKVKRTEKKIQDKNIQIELIDDFNKYSKSLYSLWMNTYNNAKEYQREIINEDYFINIKKYLGVKVKILAAVKKEKILGFFLLFDNNSIIDFLYSGLDYQNNYKYSIYYNLLYNLVRLGIEKKIKKIDMGMTTYIPKTELGCDLEYISVFIKLKYKILNKLVNINKIENEIEKSLKLENRRVFSKI
jgi:predicted N-acyltransferase